jgi:hypothetical protein
MYVDPADNDINRVIDVMFSIHLLEPDNRLHTYYFSDSLFLTLSDYLSSIQYCEADKSHDFEYKGDIVNLTPPASYLLHCLLVLARASNYQCRVQSIVRDRSDQMNSIMSQGSQYHKNLTKQLLKSLGEHSCTKCKRDLTLTTLGVAHGLSLTKKPSPATKKTTPSQGGAAAQGGQSPASTPTNCVYYTAARQFFLSLDAGIYLYNY